MDPLRLETGLPGKAPENQERAHPRQRAALGIEEELRPVAAVEVRAAARQIAAQRLDGGASDRDDPLLVALAEHADDARIEVDPCALEPDRLADAQAGAVEQLDEGGVPERAGGRAGGRLDQALGLARREPARELSLPARRVDLRRRVVAAVAEQHLVREERAR